MTTSARARDLALLCLLALLWGSSYLFIKVAVAEIPPVTLVAARVLGASAFLYLVLRLQGGRLPTERSTWASLGVQSFLSCIGAWTVLAWGQQHVDAALASVLNSTSPIFVLLYSLLLSTSERVTARRALGALIGVCGVVLIVGVEAIQGVGDQVAGQLACLAGAAMYGAAALYGVRFRQLGNVQASLGAMLWASVVLTPAALVLDQPWGLQVSANAILATACLSILSTGVALLIYFRLIKTLGSLGVASQAYLRAGVGVLLGSLLLGETVSRSVAFGLAAVILGVLLINLPRFKKLKPLSAGSGGATTS